ncbi:Bug family tripartite tricarboxylate transporter substrate binding protein [Falsiroseomonas sp. HW251]|uniref:Bug family tripartite tricarboxylate transporter substrate binding protein n=1 Tax=Falsiroseomonas sp. HW251 TaxID=3390998 RepID=UPI003D316A1F
MIGRRKAGMAMAALLAPGIANAQGTAQGAWPDRPIRMITTIPPGGAPDIVARILAERLQARLNQPVVVENRTGSNGAIAAEAVARARPDGYTLLFAQDTVFVVNPFVYDSLAVNPLTELVPVASVAANQFILSVHPSVPVRSFAEFLDYARRAGEPLPYASGGVGSQHQLAMEMLARRAGLNMLHVPFRGGTPAANATVAGDTKAVFSGTSTAPLIQAGRLRALAVTGPERSPLFPDLPRIGEVFPGYEVVIWLGLFAPPGLPDAIMARLRAKVAASLADPAMRQRLDAAGGLEPLVTTPERFAALIRSDAEKYRAIIREIGLKAE